MSTITTTTLPSLISAVQNEVDQPNPTYKVPMQWSMIFLFGNQSSTNIAHLKILFNDIRLRALVSPCKDDIPIVSMIGLEHKLWENLSAPRQELYMPPIGRELIQYICKSKQSSALYVISASVYFAIDIVSVNFDQEHFPCPHFQKLCECKYACTNISQYSSACSGIPPDVSLIGLPHAYMREYMIIRLLLNDRFMIWW